MDEKKRENAENDIPENVAHNGAGGESDIVFECEYCGKSFVIEAKGAGLLIQCPQCKNEIRVPYPQEIAEAPAAGPKPVSGRPATPEEQAPDVVVSGSEGATDLFHGADEESALEEESASDEKILVLSTELEELKARRSYLEKMRVEHSRIFQQLSSQVELLQASVNDLAEALKNAMRSAEDTQQLD